MITVTLFTRKNCHLCDQLKSDLLSLQSQYPHQLVEIDIDTDPSLVQKYGERIPVIQIGSYTRQAPITIQDLRLALAASHDSGQ